MSKSPRSASDSPKGDATTGGEADVVAFQAENIIEAGAYEDDTDPGYETDSELFYKSDSVEEMDCDKSVLG